ncbi:MAG: inorganic phosphate transporter, partial [Candidatus Dadabacteria bacterium]
MHLSPLLLTVVIVALFFDFVNGWNDSANAIATIVGTKVLSPIKAVLLAAALNMAGAFAGNAVAKTVHRGLIHVDGGFLDPHAIILIV